MNILVVAPHPDDETLGCGGTLLKYRNQGAKLFWLIGTEMDKESGYPDHVIESRRKEVEFVSNKYDFESVEHLNIPPAKIDSFPYNILIDRISEIINKIKPDIMILPFYGDVHSDHRVLFNAVFSCTKIFRYPFIKKIFMMEIISETDFAPALLSTTFIPNIYVDISEYIDEKIEIMQIYKSEISLSPFPRSINNIKALATFRGCQSGSLYAESFMLLKEVM